MPSPVPGDRPVVPETVLLAVVAAHRTGQPLHGELVALGARFVRCAVTAPAYRMLALPGSGIARGGIVRVPSGGAGVEVELHMLPTALWWAYLMSDSAAAKASTRPAPLSNEDR